MREQESVISQISRESQGPQGDVEATRLLQCCNANIQTGATSH